jgi:hypothetical protein
MLNRLSFVMLGVGIVVGYAVSGKPVQAQPGDAVPFTVGERVALTYGRNVSESYIECTVSEFRGTYVKCEARAQFRGERPETWYSLKSVTKIVKLEK